MAQFDLEWIREWADDEDLAANITAQRALYRYKAVGGDYITTGFTPANDLSPDAETTQSPVLDDNKVIEFLVEAICTQNGPTPNDNGVQEAINFACIEPEISPSFDQVEVTVDLTGLDINKVRFTIKKSSDNSIILAPTIVNKVSDAATVTKTGLTASTGYYVQVELYAIINNTQVKSSDSGFLGTPCSPYPFATEASPICDPVTSADVTVLEFEP